MDPQSPHPTPTRRPSVGNDHAAGEAASSPARVADSSAAAVSATFDEPFRFLADSVADLVWSARPDGVCDYLNRSFFEFVGPCRQTSEGWAWTDAIHPDDAESRRQEWNLACSGGTKHEGEFRLRRHDGQYRRYRVKVSPLRDANGRMTRWLAIARQIGERPSPSGPTEAAGRKKTGDELKLQARVLESMTEGVSVCDEDGTIVYTNPAEDRIFGYGPGGLVGQHVAIQNDYPPEENSRVVAGVIEELKATGSWSGEWRNRRKDGTAFWTLARITALERDGRHYFVCVQEDITERKHAEERLREAERRFRATFEQAAVGMALVALDGRWLLVNRTLCDLVGFTCEELLERTFQDITHPDDLEADLAYLRRLLDGQIGTYTMEKRYIGRDGSFVWIDLTVSLVRDDSGRPLYFISVIQDIGERKRAEEARRQSEQRFARFMQHLPGLSWIKDSSGRYVYFNDAAPRAFGIPREQLYGKTDEEVFPPETAAQFREHDRRALDAGAGLQMIETLRHPDGTIHHSLVSKFPIPNPEGGELLVGGMAIDVTDRTEMEIALKEADRRKDEFLATLAHELRNPLAPIRNGLQIMRIAGDDQPAVDEARALVERQVSHMVRLIDDLMDVSRITRGKLELRKERAGMAAILNVAVDTSRPLLEWSDHQLTLKLPSRPLHVDADPTRLAQVFSNLLNNAAKYTEAGGTITLAMERQGTEVVVSVRDNGIGIPPEMLPRVFDMFTQVDHSLERSQGGLGIGLTLVKRLVEMHGGAVEARSAGVGRGSEFVVRLPLATTSSSQPSPPEGRVRSAGPAVGRRILVVDDNRDAARTLGRLLKMRGHETFSAHDGQEALAAAEQFHPELILLDIGLPVINGYEVARMIRQHPWGGSVLIVALTGWGQEEDRRRSKESGIDHHLVKPIDPVLLEQFIDGLPVATT